jgi:undecaprenyl-diphosphatase
MSIWESLLYGAVQGLTEYLPISSSAHLALLPKFLGTTDPGLAFDVFLHSGTLAATLWYFRKDWRELFLRNHRMLFWICVATLPALVAGALVHNWAETVFRGVGVMAFTLSLFGFLLWWVDHVAQKNEGKKINAQRMSAEKNSKKIFGVGLAQCLALVPGVSRSGITLTCARWLGFSRSEAARVSFLLSAPVTAAALGYEALKLLKAPTGLGVETSALLIGGATAFVFGLLAIDVLVRRVGRLGYGVFFAYRMILAGVILRWL